MQGVFSEVDMRIKYACKANTNLAILRLMRGLGVEIDVVSVGEMRMAMLAGYAPEQITFTPSGVPFEEVQEAVEGAVKINVDSLPLLEWFGQTYGDSRPCLIRLKPNVAAGGNAKDYDPGHTDSKFGISVLLLDDILDVVKRYGLKIIGLHQHTGSDIKEAEAFLQASAVIFKAAMYFPDLQIIDLGGGFKVSYKPGDTTTDMQRLGAEITRGFQDFCKNYGRKCNCGSSRESTW